MSGFLAYPDYKTSSIPWLENIPKHWEEAPLWAKVHECKSKNNGMIEKNLLSLSYGRIVNKDINSGFGLLPESFETYQIIEKEDIVFRLTDLQNDQRSLRSAIAMERGIITSAYITIRPKGINPYFLNYLMRAYDSLKVFYAMGGGLRQSLKFEDLRRLPIPIPSINEQNEIRSFLDRETSRIDFLIEKKSKFIELLKEKRQAVITKAVTKGIAANVKIKETGIEWLEKLPAHWKTIPLKHLSTIENSGSYGEESESIDAPIGIRTATTAHITTTGEFLIDEMPIRYFSAHDAAKYTGENGDLFIVKSSGSNTNIISGKLAQIKPENGKIVFTNFLFRVRPQKKLVNSDFLEFFLSSAITRRRIERMVATTTYPNIKIDEYTSAHIPYPPLEEQKLISNFLTSELEHLRKIIKKSERSIELLKEHRTALITAAVTGKIDIRMSK